MKFTAIDQDMTWQREYMHKVQQGRFNWLEHTKLLRLGMIRMECRIESLDAAIAELQVLRNELDPNYAATYAAEQTPPTEEYANYASTKSIF